MRSQTALRPNNCSCSFGFQFGFWPFFSLFFPLAHPTSHRLIIEHEFYAYLRKHARNFNQRDEKREQHHALCVIFESALANRQF